MDFCFNYHITPHSEATSYHWNVECTTKIGRLAHRSVAVLEFCPVLGWVPFFLGKLFSFIGSFFNKKDEEVCSTIAEVGEDRDEVISIDSEEDFSERSSEVVEMSEEEIAEGALEAWTRHECFLDELLKRSGETDRFQDFGALLKKAKIDNFETYQEVRRIAEENAIASMISYREFVKTLPSYAEKKEDFEFKLPLEEPSYTYDLLCSVGRYGLYTMLALSVIGGALGGAAYYVTAKPDLFFYQTPLS